MRAGKIILQIAVLYFIYLIGTGIQQALHLFIPGSVIGLILMFILLASGVFRSTWVGDGAQFMIRHLTLFFIPATVGIMSYFKVFEGKGVLLIGIVLLSTIMVMATAGGVSQWLARKRGVRHE